MNKLLFLKIVKIVGGFGLFIIGLDFIKQVFDIYKSNQGYEHSNIRCIIDLSQNPIWFFITGSYLIILGLLLMSSLRFFIKFLTIYSFTVAVYYFSNVFLFSLVNFQINISLEFINRIFMFYGMIYLTNLISHFENFEWKNFILKNYKIAIILGIFFTILDFYML